MASTEARTLGEYFAHLDPEATRVRRIPTARAMYAEEFDAIWRAQAVHHPSLLGPDLRKRVRSLILEQRPLKSQAGRIGSCDLYPGKPRAPWALPEAQRFRLLQRVNDLEVIAPNTTGEARVLTAEERTTLIDALETRGDLTFARVRSLLRLNRGSTFNLEAGGEKKLVGNRTTARLASAGVFGAAWTAISPADRTRVVEEWLATRDDAALARRGQVAWGLGAAEAERFASTSLEPGYCHLSRKALRDVLPRMERGERYASVRRDLVPARYAAGAPAALLPSPPRLGNPIVERTLTQVRKVVNAVIREHGLPTIVRVELARDVREPRRRRAEASRRNRTRESDRADARMRILREAGIEYPSRNDVEKALLWDECAHICPYTGRSISFAGLFGAEPEFDVEHILPRSRSLDNSFANKTLCETGENRRRKRNLTPFEAYASDPRRWDQILQRVRAFRGDLAREKLRRFMLGPEEVSRQLEDFSSRQLNDTRFASRACAEYLGALYGGRSDADHRQRVQVGRGQVTALIRATWDLNSILGDGGVKDRTDHRHHAVDAVCVAVTSPATLKALGEAADRGERMGRRGLDHAAAPWDTFREDVGTAVDAVTVSHVARRGVNGPLHEETHYPPESPDGSRHVRIPIADLEQAQIRDDDAIVDPRVRDAIRSFVEARGGSPRALGDEEDPPTLLGGDGRSLPIRHVRVRKRLKTIRIGLGHRERHVKTGSNHHVAIFETTGPSGTRWVGEVVTRIEALARVRARKPVIRRESGAGRAFLFSLVQGEAVLANVNERRGVYIVANISESGSGRVELQLRWHSDARTVADLKAAKARIRVTPDDLRRAMGGVASKLSLGPTGSARHSRE